jgi:spermidine synthase
MSRSGSFWLVESVIASLLESMKQAFENIVEDTDQYQKVIEDLEKNGQWQRLIGSAIDPDQFKADILAKAKEKIILEQASYSQEQRRF